MLQRPLLLAGLVGVLTPFAVAGAIAAGGGGDDTGSAGRAPSRPVLLVVDGEPYLTRQALEELSLIRRISGDQAQAVTTVARPCLRRYRGARRSSALRTCAFRPLAAAGAARMANGMILGRIRARLTRGPCSAMLGEFGGLLSSFSMSAETFVRTFGSWPQTQANLVYAGQLATQVRRASRDPAWRPTCTSRGPRA